MSFKEQKIKEFLSAALMAKKELKKKHGADVNKDYIYINLVKLIEAVENDTYPPMPRSTDIGVAAIKGLDFESELCSLICNVSHLYRRLPK